MQPTDAISADAFSRVRMRSAGKKIKLQRVLPPRARCTILRLLHVPRVPARALSSVARAAFGRCGYVHVCTRCTARARVSGCIVPACCTMEDLGHPKTVAGPCPRRFTVLTTLENHAGVRRGETGKRALRATQAGRDGMRRLSQNSRWFAAKWRARARKIAPESPRHFEEFAE